MSLTTSGVDRTRPMTAVPAEMLVYLRQARDLIDCRYLDALRLEDVAAAAGVSKYRFVVRCFAAASGKTPGVYLTERRIEGRGTCWVPPT